MGLVMLWPQKEVPWLDYCSSLDPSFLQILSLASVRVDLFISELYFCGNLFQCYQKNIPGRENT